MLKHERELLKRQMRLKNEWMYRAMIFERVLKYLGYNPQNIMGGDYETLQKVVLKDGKQLLFDFMGE